MTFYENQGRCLEEFQAVFRIVEIVEHAFDACYPAEDDGWDEYPYNVIVLEDRQGTVYLWPTSDEDGYMDEEGRARVPFWKSLKQGACYKLTYRLRDEWPGAEQEWHSAVPEGELVSHVRGFMAPKHERWGQPPEPTKRGRLKGNLARLRNGERMEDIIRNPGL